MSEEDTAQWVNENQAAGRRVVGRPGLRPPPGFEHLVSASPAGQPAGQTPATEVHSQASQPKVIDQSNGSEPNTENSEIRPLLIPKTRVKQAPMADDHESADGTSPSRPSPQSIAFEQVSSNAGSSGAEFGIFPLPPPVPDQVETMSEANASITTVETSVRPVAPVPAVRIASTHAPLSPRHCDDLEKIMKRKAQDIKEYEHFENFSIMHMDWAAGNPNDPQATPSAGAAKYLSLTTEELELQNRVAELVAMSIKGAEGDQRDDDWSKSMFFGDRLQAKNGENMFFIEIQLKRISGADDNLLTRCGVNPRYVWLSLRDMDHAIDPTIMSGTLRLPQFDFNFKKLLPSVTDSPEGSGKIASDVVDKKGSDNTQDEQQQNLITPPTPRLASVDLPTRNLTRVAEASLKRLAAFGRSGTTNIEKKAKVEEESGAPAQPGIDLSAPDLVTVPLSDDDAKDEATAANDGKPSGIPRSLPMPHSNSWGNIVAVAGDGDDKNNNGDSVVIDKEQFSDDGIGLGIGNSDPKTEDATPLVQNCLAPHLPALQKTLRVKREEMADDLAKDPAFPERKEKSSIYVVRAVAMPYPPYAPNVFSGPRIGDRYATLLSSGGWVVPPLEERIKWRNVHYKTNLPTSTTDSSTADDKTRVQVCCAKSANFDWSNNGPPRYYGEGAPVWRELADPCLEDVHWMVWQLLAGKQFVGFRTGSGFGMVRGNTSGDRVKLDECPFSSPSREAIRLSKEMEMELLASASLANDVKAEPETETEIQFL